MMKSVKYARAVILQFEKDNGQILQDLIIDSIENHDLNEHLADTYSSLGTLVFFRINNLTNVYSTYKILF